MIVELKPGFANASNILHKEGNELLAIICCKAENIA
jgi:hypothetical protein